MSQSIPHQALGYRPDVDGLRAVAVLAVLGFHAFPHALRGGFVGVDIFFVISGYLISSIILDALNKGRFTYADFYARRIRRIFPALALVLVVSTALGAYVLLSDEFREFGGHVAAGAGFAANLLLWSEAGYFERAAESKPLLHLWSLGIEEQFYILWPAIIGFLWRHGRRFMLVAGLIASVSFAINVGLIARYPTATFYSPVSRFWELMVGGMLAYVASGATRKPLVLPERWANAASLTGLALLALAIVGLSKYRLFPGFWALMPVVGAVLLIVAGPQAWANRLVLSNRGAVWVGKISYPLYLWHWPLLCFASIIVQGEPTLGARLALVAASFLLAWATFAIVESRVRFNRSRFTVPVLAFVMVAMAVAGIAVRQGLIAPRHADPALQKVVEAVSDWAYPDGFETRLLGDHRVRVRQGGARETLVVGDSHAEQYGPRIVQGIGADPATRPTVLVTTSGGCPPIPQVFEDRHPACEPSRMAAQDLVRRTSVSTVVVVACWACYFAPGPDDGDRYRYYVKLEDGKRLDLVEPQGRARALANLETRLRELAATRRVVLVLNSPRLDALNPGTFISGSRLGTMSVAPVATVPLRPDQRQLNSDLAAVAQRAGVQAIDPLASLCPDDRCLATTADGRPVYKDNSHLRPFYVREHATYVDDAFR